MIGSGFRMVDCRKWVFVVFELSGSVTSSHFVVLCLIYLVWLPVLTLFFCV